MLPRTEPPTPKGRYYELRARGLREFAGLKRDDERLDPFDLARAAGLLVAPFDQIAPLLTPETREHLLGDGSGNWSGGAASHVLPDGRKLIILNPTHGKTRQQATLMEEVSHLFYGHTPSRLAIQKKDKNGKVVARDYNNEIEEEAYSTGAAALVPFTALARMVSAGRTIKEIAKHFGVSPALVEFRIKISKLWDNYAANVFSGDDR
ncbi:MAG TPA: ImmA/IrrE family metallo-endopeptidase [Pyrinomonadaceae bacterium]|nr:ImmA/IrrE family metallo-endopeptidase [Pyrinomonadaceae bacterium]